jgi:tellurite resistance protein
MSLIDRLRMRRAEEAIEQLTVVVPATTSNQPVGSAIPPRPSGMNPTLVGQPTWVPPGQSVTIANQLIPGGMLYVGSSRGPGDRSRDPSTIDPSLPVNLINPDWSGANLPYYPSYRDIPPTSRGAYLSWLAEGKSRLDINVGYVFIYFYGLERRALIDARQNPRFRSDIPLIRAEVRRLLSLYGLSNPSFRQYASSFLGLLDIVDDPKPGSSLTLPTFGTDRWRVPPALRVAISQFAHEGRPLPAEWALAWSQFRAERWPKTSATRLPDEFARLFAIRYRERYGEGIIPARGWKPLRIDYRPASGVLQPVSITISSLTDSFDDGAGVNAIGKLVEEVSEELAPLSKWRGRNPALPLTSVSALGALPDALLDRIEGDSLALLRVLQTKLGDDQIAISPFSDLIAFWPGYAFTRTEATQVIQALQVLGFGMEPDLRFAGPIATGTDQVALFHLRHEIQPPASPALATATLMAQIAVGVAIADGALSESESMIVVRHLADRLGLTPGERDRIEAHLSWLATRKQKPTTLRTRLRALSVEQSEAAGDLIIAVAAADGSISPIETKLVQRVFEMLQLDADAALQRLFDAGAGIVRHSVSRSDSSQTSAEFSLDLAAIEAKLLQSQVASAIIADVFDSDEPEFMDVIPGEVTAADESARLDENSVDRFAPLIVALAAHDEWSRESFVALCAIHSVVFMGAIDTLNERAMDACDEPLIEGDDPLHINRYALEALTE